MVLKQASPSNAETQTPSTDVQHILDEASTNTDEPPEQLWRLETSCVETKQEHRVKNRTIFHNVTL